MHFTFIGGIYFTYQHTSKIWDIIYPCVILYAIDKAVMLLNFLIPAKVKEVKILEDDEYYYNIFRQKVLRMVIHKPLFYYQAGQYVSLFNPTISLLSHPFSIANYRNKDNSNDIVY